MKNNVVSIRSRNTSRNIFEAVDPVFLLGVGASLIAPQAIASAYFGTLLALVLGICALIALALGGANYGSNPERFISIIPREDQRSPSSEEDRLKLAA